MSVVHPSSGEVPVVPDDLYTATIKSVKDISLDTPDQFGKTEKVEINLEFEVDGEMEHLDPRVNRAWSEKATLFHIAQAAGIDCDPFEPFDTADLVGKKVKILTEQEEGKWPRVKSWSRATQARQRASQKPTEAHEHELAYKANGEAVCAVCSVPMVVDEGDLPFE